MKKLSRLDIMTVDFGLGIRSLDWMAGFLSRPKLSTVEDSGAENTIKSC